MTGFRKMCEKIAPAIFIFDTENQLESDKSNVKMVMRYSDVICMMNPNRICFKNDAGTLCFNRVKSVKYHDEQEVVGEIFNIVCGSSNNDNKDILIRYEQFSRESKGIACSP